MNALKRKIKKANRAMSLTGRTRCEHCGSLKHATGSPVCRRKPRK